MSLKISRESNGWKAQLVCWLSLVGFVELKQLLDHRRSINFIVDGVAEISI
jgi:hypothetical protein